MANNKSATIVQQNNQSATIAQQNNDSAMAIKFPNPNPKNINFKKLVPTNQDLQNVDFPEQAQLNNKSISVIIPNTVLQNTNSTDLVFFDHVGLQNNESSTLNDPNQIQQNSTTIILPNQDLQNSSRTGQVYGLARRCCYLRGLVCHEC